MVDIYREGDRTIEDPKNENKNKAIITWITGS